MEPVITFTTDDDSIEFTGTDIAGAFIYDNDALSSWLKLAEVDGKFNKRPNAHGTYTPDQLFVKEKRINFPGRYFSTSSLDAAIARDRLAALFTDGRKFTMSVTDDLGTTSREVFMVAYDPEWMPDGNFTFEAEFAAPDPRRYGALATIATGLATASSGLVWPLGTGSAFWDWGTPGSTGRVVFANTGNTTSYPAFLAGSGGDLPGGFAITEVETGRTLTYSADTDGAIVRLDARTQRATINGADVTRNLTRKEWPSIPARASREYQFVALGTPTGAPTLQLLAANANL